MRLPIDTSRLRFLVVAEAEPLKKLEDGKPREAWAPRTDSGQMALSTYLHVMSDLGDERISAEDAIRQAREALVPRSYPRPPQKHDEADVV